MTSLVSAAFLRLWIGNTASGLAIWALPFVLGLAVVDGDLTATDLALLLPLARSDFRRWYPLQADVRSTWSKADHPHQVLSELATLLILAGLSGSDSWAQWRTAYVAGTLVGALLLTRWHPVDRGWMALAGLDLWTGLFSPLFADSMMVPIAAYFIAGIGIEIFNVPWFTAIQNEIPKDRLSRVPSLISYFHMGWRRQVWP